MFLQRISVYLCFVSTLYPNLSVGQLSAQILSQNARIQRLCSEMSTTCARSCQAYIGHCNLNVGIPPPIADMVQMTQPPQVPVHEPTSPVIPMPSAPPPPQTIENIKMRCWAREDFLQRLCSEMSTTCARNCQTFIEQCNLSSGSAVLPSQDELSQFNPPVADVPQQQQQPSTIVPIINPTSASKPTAQQNCKNHKDPCVDHRDCCDFLYCRRFTHPTGAEAKLGYCEHDPGKY